MWNGQQIMQKLDSLAPFPVFESLYEKYRGARQFPAYQQTLEQLGVRAVGKTIELDNHASLSHVRDAIMTSGLGAATPIALNCSD